MTKEELVPPIMITVPLAEAIELQRLVNLIQYPNCTYVPEESLMMANNAIRLMQQVAGNIFEILERWTGG